LQFGRHNGSDRGVESVLYLQCLKLRALLQRIAPSYAPATAPVHAVFVTFILHAAYIQKRSGSKLEVAKDITSVIFQVSPSFDPASPSEATRITAAVNTTFGSAHAKIPVPKDATPAGYTLQLFTVIKTTPPSSDGTVVVLNSAEGVIPLDASSSSAAVAAMPESAMQSEPQPAVAVAPGFDGVVPPKLPPVPVEQPGDLLASASFTVGDPRPPTATLSIDAPAWVKPTDSVTVRLTAESYIGSGEEDESHHHHITQSSINAIGPVLTGAAERGSTAPLCLQL
jgi:hypothetical protein